MKRQVFIFEFPKTSTTIKAEVNPLCVKDMAIQYIDKQETAFGDICLIREGCNEDIVAIACRVGDSSKVKFFTEDDSINKIKELEVCNE